MGRVLLAVIAGYMTDAILVLFTEMLLARFLRTTKLHFFYFWIDLVTQCLYTIIGGYICCLMARSRKAAMAGLIGTGIVVGAFSLSTSWKTEPHWYGIALLAVYPFCVWIGWTLRRMRSYFR